MFSGILKLLILKGRFAVTALRSIPENDFFIIATQPVPGHLLPPEILRIIVATPLSIPQA